MGKILNYDIRSSENALRTLIEITGVAEKIWNRNVINENKYRYTEDFVEDIVLTYGEMPERYDMFEFIYFHITTSANQCESIRKYGLLDLKKSYKCKDSELRKFLDESDVLIDLENAILIYKNKRYDISYGKCPYFDDEAKACWSIGRKFYYDYTSCGFLSIWEKSPYGGMVHRRPEILYDIDKLLGLKLSYRWAETHIPYVVVAKVSGDKIVYDGDDNQNDKEKVIDYLTRAYKTAYYEPDEQILLLQNNIEIPPKDIVEIREFRYWK